VIDVSIIVVAYESRPLLERCLEALVADAVGATTSREVIVVDQASSDGTADWLREERPDVQLVALERNVGFGAGNNRGLAVAQGRWVLLLNSDAFVRLGAIDELVRFGDARPAAGAVGPRLLWEDGRLQRSCRSFPTVYRVATEYLFLRKLAPNSMALNAFYCGGFAHDEPRRVDWVTGAAVLVRRELMQRIGGFDEAFFLYSEEVDLLRRVHDAGLEVWFDPAAEAVHVWGGTTRRDPGPSYREQLRSHVRYLDKHEGRAAARRGRQVLLAGLRLRGLRSAAFRDAASWLAARSVEELLAPG
jgi:GT2 family glycosyltransferase